MKSIRPFRSAAALAALLAFALPAAAADGTYSFSFAAADVEFRDFGLWGLHPEMKDCEDGRDEPGFPWLPQKTVSIAIPEDATVASIEVEADWAVLREGIDIEPAQEAFPTDGRKAEPTPPDAAAYASADPYPAAAAVLEGNHRMRGRPFANVILRPLAYVPATKELRIATAIRRQRWKRPLRRCRRLSAIRLCRSSRRAEHLPSLFSGRCTASRPVPRANSP